MTMKLSNVGTISDNLYVLLQLVLHESLPLSGQRQRWNLVEIGTGPFVMGRWSDKDATMLEALQRQLLVDDAR